MRNGALAADAVSVRSLRARGISGPALRQQLAAVAVPPTRRFVFVRRVVLRAAPGQVSQAMATAVSALAGDAPAEVLTFADFPAVAVACARAALTGGLGGGLGGGWHWRALGLPAAAGAGEALAILLRGWPLEAGAVVAALAAQELLAPVWRDLSEPLAAQVTAALAQAACVPVPAWPAELPLADREAETPATARGGAREHAAFAGQPPPDFAAALLARAAAFWEPALRTLPRRHEAIRTAAVLALLRSAPTILQAGDSPVWPMLLARLGDAGTPRPRLAQTPTGVRRDDPAPAAPVALAQPPDAAPALPMPEAAPRPAAVAAGPQPSRAHGEALSTAWGGLLFLINVLECLEVDRHLAACGPAAPTGWRLLHDLGLAFGMPPDEQFAVFLDAQDLATVTPPDLLARLLAAIAARFAAAGPWPLPLAQPGVLRATETHLDLDLGVRHIDIAVRMAGLDLDPGWVPWLGRIVAFHYPNLPTAFAWGA